MKDEFTIPQIYAPTPEEAVPSGWAIVRAFFYTLFHPLIPRRWLK